MEIYHNDSKMMFHRGRTQEEYENWKYYDPLKMTITNSPQVDPDFINGTDDPTDPNYVQNPIWKRHSWFFILSLGIYKRRDEQTDLHALLVAAKDLFTSERWEEILDGLESRGGIKKYLDKLDLDTVKRKARKARDLGLITTAELQSLSGIL